MRNKYRLFLRGRTFWCQDNTTGKQTSLGTKVREDAIRILHAKNEAHLQPSINRHIAIAYLMVSDPGVSGRTWQFVMDELVKLKHGVTKARWEVAIKDRALDGLRKLPLLETNAEHFLRALSLRKVSTNVFLRRIHNFALAMSWLTLPIIPKAQWPDVTYQEKRAITRAEHEAIVACECHPERRAFYQLSWHLGASQSDVAELKAENIDWQTKVVSYSRKKSGELAFVHFGEELAAILRTLPQEGALFPALRRLRAGDRATLFKERCLTVGVRGVSLHSYRYAWAERAKTVGYPERFAQIALGHNSNAVHRAYARKAQVVLPSLESFERSHAETEVLSLSAATEAVG